MSRELFSRNADLKRLREEGYFVRVVGGALVMRAVPYVDSQRQVHYGTLVSSLTLAGDQTCRPDTHVVFFDGEFPCEADGSPMRQIAHQNVANTFGSITARYSFSSKPEGGYADYYQKMATYASILSGPAAVLKPGVTAKVHRTPDEEEESVFNYIETASDRVGMGVLTQRFASHRVAIIGIGGTGSYVLDLVAKTPVAQIRLFDGDEFLTHNAFRAPGAPAIEELREAPRKVDYFKGIYARMHRGISAHPALDASNLDLLQGITFAFICIDAGESKRLAVERLEIMGVPFIDVGMGLELVNDSLGGILRVSTSTPSNRHEARKHMSFAGGGVEDVYASNIQVADLNALNAVLAVIKWKKLIGFYRDLEKEHQCTYTTDGNMLLNGDGE
ncbi:MAG: ThiF family adenylyltransferase [Acidobacteriota bacterium]|nr:ThiF family adenylyltransferase [Acidobacteriota bacterium]